MADDYSEVLGLLYVRPDAIKMKFISEKELINYKEV